MTHAYLTATIDSVGVISALLKSLGRAKPIATGARFGQPTDFWHRWEVYAPDAYDNIRVIDDTADIARHVRWPEYRIRRVKEHIFFCQHQLDDGMRRFDPDPDIADTWHRLQQGNHVPEDIRLLEHEYFESRFEGIFRTSYRTAHNKTIESGRTWEPPLL